MSTSWRRFEQLVKQIQQQLSPDAEVKLDEVLVGKSGVSHQCDVTVRAKVGQYEFFAVIECKDWRDRVGLSIVRNFKSTLDDLEAMQGALVCRKGYSKSAAKFAKFHNIKLYTLVDAENVNWAEQALIPIVLVRTWLREAGLNIMDPVSGKSVGLMQADGRPVVPSESYLFDIQENKYLTYKDFMEQQWNIIFKQRQPSEDELVKFDSGRYFLYLGDRKHMRVEVSGKFAPHVEYYHGHLPLKRCRGLIDQATGELLTTEFTSYPLVFREVLATWDKTESFDEIPIRAMHTFFMGHFFGLEPPNRVQAVELSLCPDNVTA